jgi:hypothetical protein
VAAENRKRVRPFRRIVILVAGLDRDCSNAKRGGEQGD